MGADSIFLTVEDITALCSSPEKASVFAGIFNVCLGHKSLDNWTLVPASAAWCNIPVFPNGAHATVLGEDKVTALLFATSNSLQTPRDWTGEQGWVSKPRGLGSSEGLSLSHEGQSARQGWFSEPFVPGEDVTATFLYNPATQNIESIGALLVTHEASEGFASMWTKDKKSQGVAKHKIRSRRFVHLTKELEEKCLKLAEQLCMRTAFRVDFRYPGQVAKELLGSSDLYFLEINPTPTLSSEGSFGRTVREALYQHNRITESIVWNTDDFEAFAIANMIVSVPNETTAWC